MTKISTSHTDLGRQGEELAVAFLEKKGFVILNKNWRYKHLEIDIVAKDGNVMVFVEVKTRRTSYFGNPEDAVSQQKIARLIDAAEAYIIEKFYNGESRFDIVSIIFPRDKSPELEHFEDAFGA